ncbi:MAG: thiamine phosphate synthase [Burkholderiaceae bacterium]
MSKHVLRGLCAITPDGWPENRLLEATARILRGGARIVQFRDKSADSARRTRLARALREQTRHHDVLLIINDDVQLARACGADGVHLGREDGDIAAARALLGKAALIGVSCYDQLALAQAAIAQGADYIAFGSVFASSTKPAAVRAPLALFGQAAPLGLPRVAIGGITLANAPQVVAAGADAIAVISALYDAPDPHHAAHQFAQLFDPS